MEQTIMARYQSWMRSDSVPKELREELSALRDEEEITDRFYRDLSFGTGGLRGKMGAGTTRMNVLTVGKATQGLAWYLKARTQTPSVCIAYDTRNHSREFAEHTAKVLCGNGIQVYLFDTIHPTPMLSFAVRHLGASAGVVVTASHNPKEYNGYKVYGPNGGQITDETAAAILREIQRCDLLTDVQFMDLPAAEQAGLLHWIGEDVDAPYFQQVEALAMRRDLIRREAKNLKILYSPLHGTGNIPVRRVLRELGFTQVAVVPQQELPDGNFPTAPYPNPEDPSVFRLAVELAEREEPDLIFATDPDCDRIGVLTRTSSGEYVVLTGNQTGALLCDYVIRTHQELGTMPTNPAIIKTIVTSDFGKRICEKNGVDMAETLTGFKYIGELADQWERTGEHSFLLGFEESYGYLAGNFVRDKDGVIASALIAEMALYHKSKGRTLYQALEALMETYGCFQDKLVSVTLPGQSGQRQIGEIMDRLRAHYHTLLAEEDPAVWEDYQLSRRTLLPEGQSKALTLPRSNVVKCVFRSGDWFVLRPSGTEPKIKLYLSVRGDTLIQAQEKMEHLEKVTSALLATPAEED